MQALAVRRRPASQSVYDILYREASAMHSRAEHRRAAATAAELQVCWLLSLGECKLAKSEQSYMIRYTQLDMKSLPVY